MADAEEWQTARSGKKNGHRKANQAAHPVKPAQDSSRKIKAKAAALAMEMMNEDDGVSCEKLAGELEKCKEALRNTHYFRLLLERLRGDARLMERLAQVSQVYALGLGSFAASRNALAQLALLLLIEEFLVEQTSRSVPLFLFDPVMRSVDRELCQSAHITVLPDNRKGRYDASCGPSLFFMPHCPYRLYCNVLWGFWERLDSLIILGNSFASYAERRFALQGSADKTDSVRLLSDAVSELGLWPLTTKAQRSADEERRAVQLEAAFCETSAMYFDSSRLSARIEALPPKPSDDELDRANELDEELW